MQILNPYPLKRRRTGLMVLALAVMLGAATRDINADSTPDSLATLEGLVTQWSQLRLTTAQEERAFADKQGQWQSEIAILKQEVASLQSEEDAAHSKTNSAAQEAMSLIEEKARLEQFHQALPTVLSQAEANLLQWQQRLPHVHRDALKNALARLPTEDDQRASLSNAERLQTVIALYSEIEKLQSDWFVGKQVLSLPENTQREMDVCYLGLSRAYAVSSDNQHAAIGTPGPSGWQWAPRDDLAGTIRTAIGVYQRETPAKVIRLPLAITEVAE